MSMPPAPSPLVGPKGDDDEASLPQGNCRYIMMMPEVRGSRCACVNFTLNKSVPGATCECGHLACFHQRTSEPPVDKQELDLLRNRVQQLEDLLSRSNGAEMETVQRVSELEEAIETRTEEMCQEIKKTYGNLNRAWHSIGTLERRTGEHDRRFQGLGSHLQTVDSELRRLHERQCELNDADLSLEERILEVVEHVDEVDGQVSARVISEGSLTPGRTGSISRSTDAANQPEGRFLATSQHTTMPPPTTFRPTSMPFRVATSAASECWTVHVSLLPNKSLPFPFERNTNAYKRCLSRGLHQMVVVGGASSEAFTSAVSSAFHSLLRGRPWGPLQAKLCDAETLQGLPMLRLLDPALVNARSGFDLDFLRTHCAVLDKHGKIDSLYIAMQYSTLSWHALRHAPVCLSGLEASWEYDPMLDANDPFEDDDHSIDAFRPSAGDLVGSFPNLKRAASEISRSSSFGAATACASHAAASSPAAAAAPASSAATGERPCKIPRTSCPVPNIPEPGRRQRIETA